MLRKLTHVSTKLHKIQHELTHVGFLSIFVFFFANSHKLHVKFSILQYPNSKLSNHSKTYVIKEASWSNSTVFQFCKFQIVHWNGWFVSNFSTPPFTLLSQILIKGDCVCFSTIKGFYCSAFWLFSCPGGTLLLLIISLSFLKKVHLWNKYGMQ